MEKIYKAAIKIRSDLLHTLLSRIAQRAYEAGYEDASNSKEKNLDRLRIDPSLMRKFL